MGAGLEERFNYLKNEKQKDLEQEGRSVPLEFELVDEDALAREARRQKIWREVALFLLASAVAVGLGFGLWSFFADDLVGREFMPGIWAPPDESDFPVVSKIEEGFWREIGGLFLTSGICLVGVYLTRLVHWAVSTFMIEQMNKEG